MSLKHDFCPHASLTYSLYNIQYALICSHEIDIFFVMTKAQHIRHSWCRIKRTA